MFNDLKDNNGNISSMRTNNRILIISVAMLLIAVPIYIIINAFNKMPIDGGTWGGIGGYVTGIGVLVTGVLYNQRSQKKVELENELKK